MRTFILLCVSGACSVAVACGGDAFTAAISGGNDAGGDAGGEATAGEGGFSESGGTIDAGDAGSMPDSAPVDSAPSLDGSHEAGNDALPTCTPIPSQTLRCGYASGAFTYAQMPSQFCIYGSQDGHFTAQSTPPQCQCMETYDCTCLTAVSPCNAQIQPTSCGPGYDPQVLVVQCLQP